MFQLKSLLLKKGQNVEVQIFFTINKTSTIFVQFCSNFQDLFYPWVDQSLKVWVKSDKNCRFFVNGEKNLHFYILTFLKQQTFYKFRVESNWIRSKFVCFENLPFNWFAKAKKFKNFNNFQFKIGSIQKKFENNLKHLQSNSVFFVLSNFDSQATLNWRYIINDHVHLYLICDRLTLINHTSSYTFPGFWISRWETEKMTHFLPRKNRETGKNSLLKTNFSNFGHFLAKFFKLTLIRDILHLY